MFFNDRMDRKSASFKVEKALESEDRSIGTIKGYASVFNSVDLVGDTILPGAFSDSIKRFRKDNKMIPMLSGHSMDKVIGGFDPSKMRETEDGLYVEGQIDLDTQRGREDFSLMKKGFMSGMSIGGYTTPEDSTMRSDGRDIMKFDLHEISVTPMPAEPNAQVTDVKAVPPYKDYAIIDGDPAWDKSKAISQIRDKTSSEDEPSAGYRNGFMYFDSSDSKNFGAYKLPYVYVVDGEYKVVPKALSAIAGALSGARGGLDIPDADKAKVRAQVERYYRKMGKESPFKDSDDKSLNVEQNCDRVEKASNLDMNMAVMKLNNLIWRIKK